MSSLVNSALSSKKIVDFLKTQGYENPKIFIYHQLANYDDIDKVLGENGMCILLYETKKNFGHWVCLFKRNNEIEHFDSYGIFPDYELKLVDENMRDILGQRYPHLSYLLEKSPYKLHYNHHVLQKRGSTCGRWCLARILNRNLNENQFAKLFSKYKDKDLIISKVINI